MTINGDTKQMGLRLLGGLLQAGVISGVLLYGTVKVMGTEIEHMKVLWAQTNDTLSRIENDFKAFKQQVRNDLYEPRRRRYE